MPIVNWSCRRHSQMSRYYRFFWVYMQAIIHTKLFWSVRLVLRPLSGQILVKTTRFDSFLDGPETGLYQMPYRILQKILLVFAFKPPLVHLELQNTPQTLSGCITHEYYRFWKFQHNRSTKTGLTVIKLLHLDFSGSKGLQLSIDPKSRQSNFTTVSPVLVLRLCCNSQKR